MTDAERFDWLEQRGGFVCKWDHQRGFILQMSPHVSGEGQTFREALDSLIRRWTYVRANWTH
jgi:hypothetical protein